MQPLLRLLLRVPFLPARVRFALRRAIVIRGYAEPIASAVKSKDLASLQSAKDSQRWELDFIAEDEGQHWTAKTIRTANRLYLSVPPLYNEDGSLSDMWEDGAQLGYRLSYKGMAALREKIRAEQKSRREGWSVLIGVLGAVTGVVSAIKG